MKVPGDIFYIFSTWSDAPNAISSRLRHISGTKFHQISTSAPSPRQVNLFI